jgi:hypothetical protein
MFASSKVIVAGLVVSLTSVSFALAQAPGPLTPGPAAPLNAATVAAANSADAGASAWRPPTASGANNAGGSLPFSSKVAPTATRTSAAVATAIVPHAPIAKVTNGNGTLPNDKGQIWREYDISPYTLRVTSTNRPEQAIVDWILRETGYEAWHSDPVGLLSADHRTLRVYHTPEMQAVVSEMVDRFVNTEAETQSFGLRIASIGSASWRAKAQRILHPIAVQSQGVQAWMLAKEDASLLVADMRKRSDFREYNSPYLLVNNGQSTVVSTMRPRNYSSAVILHPEQAHPGFEPQISQFEEGFSLEFSPLLSLDGRSIDAMLKCHVDQLEKMVPVTIDVPTVIAPRQHTDIEVPQWVSYRVHERFHWPNDQVLLISFGVIATPLSVEPSVKVPLLTQPARSEMLVFVDNRGANGKPPVAPAKTGARDNSLYRGRY